MESPSLRYVMIWIAFFTNTKVVAWTLSFSCRSSYAIKPLRLTGRAGTFFNPIPDDAEGDSYSDDNATDAFSFQDSIDELLKTRKAPLKSSQPSTINGQPTAGQGFGTVKESRHKPTKTFVGVGSPLNDVTKPEVDDQGYTLYANEETGEKSRVFEALVDYPCEFTLKIVGANEGAFVDEMVALVAESCNVDTVRHSIRNMGRWTSVTVHAPVDSAEMLYALYEKVDRDPRVKFKF